MPESIRTERALTNCERAWMNWEWDEATRYLRSHVLVEHALERAASAEHRLGKPKFLPYTQAPDYDGIKCAWVSEVLIDA